MLLNTQTAARGATAHCPFTGADAATVGPRQPLPLLRGPDPEQTFAEARDYLHLLEREGVQNPAATPARLAEIGVEVRARGTYRQTEAELTHGAKLAWRNSSRCIGRLYWQKLEVRDLRHLTTAEQIFEACVDHIRWATNEGKIRSTISVFAPQKPGSPGIRIWSPQLIRYAGYRDEQGNVIGDPAMAELTEICRKLGWKGGAGTPFDVLPLVIHVPGDEPKLFEIPRDAILEVPLSHPDYPWFEELGLKWYALPAVSNMRLEAGGVSYTAAPFNGWYMGTEIGARNFSDEDRYDLLPTIANRLGLDTRSSRRLWKDRALVELNVAVLHSYQEAGVAIIDHHTASKHFMRHVEFERQADRPVPADWSWVVPPMSASACPVFHREMHDTVLKPNFFYQSKGWEGYVDVDAQPHRSVDDVFAQRDGLTGLLHRAALDRRLADFGRDGGAIALLDVDGFQRFIEQHTEVAGNALLRALGRTLLGVVRPDDVCARYGSDGFCVLLPGLESDDDARAVAERIRRAVAAIRVEDAPSVSTRLSMGIGFVPVGTDAMAALRRAERALKQAQQQGGGGLVLDLSSGSGDASEPVRAGTLGTLPGAAADAPAAAGPLGRLANRVRAALRR